MENLQPLEISQQKSVSYESVAINKEFEVNENQIVHIGKTALSKPQRKRSGSVPLIVIQKDITDELIYWNFKSDLWRFLKELPATDLCSTEL